MKKINFIIIALLFLTALSYSQSNQHYSPGGYDTLLFDGADNRSSFYDKAFDDCYVYVEHVSGDARGTIITKKLVPTCGDIDTVTIFKKGKLKQGDKVEAGQVITTGPGSYLSLMFPDRKQLRLSPGSKMVFNKDYCHNDDPIEVLLEEGIMYGDDRFGNKAKTFHVTTKNSSSIVDGTLFTVGTVVNGSDTTEILKVYEGSVRFQLKLNQAGDKRVEDKGARIKQIYDDYQNGKLTMQEFSQKMQDAEKDLTETVPKEPVHVTAGFQSTIINGANATDPAPLDVNEDRWFEGTNFGE